MDVESASPVSPDDMDIPNFENRVFARLLYNDEGNLNEYGIKIGVAIYLLSLAVMLLTSFKTHRDQKRAQLGDANKLAMESELRIWKTVSSAECDAEGNRINSILKYSTKISKAGVIDTQRMKTEGEKWIEDGYNPVYHINSILEQVKHCISKLTAVTQNHIYISAAVSVDGGEWSWLLFPQGANIASLDELLSNNSTFKSVANGTPYLYYNDKKRASEEDCYFIDGKDKSVNSIGSIICWEVDGAYSEKCKIRMIVSISTTGMQLIEGKYAENDAVLEKFYIGRIRNIVLQQFENDLIEDLLLYRLICN